MIIDHLLKKIIELSNKELKMIEKEYQKLINQYNKAKLEKQFHNEFPFLSQFMDEFLNDYDDEYE